MPRNISDDEFNRIAEQAARDDDVVPDHEMSYEGWLDWTGKDDSFVGSPERGILGTYDVYEAAIRVYKIAEWAHPGPQ
jgi:hypothetical protein